MRRIGNPAWGVALAAAFSGASALHAATSYETIPVTSDPADQFDPAIRGSLVAYTDLAAGNADIWVFDINTRSYERVGNSAAQQTVEDIDGNVVVFTDNRAGAGQDDIWGYDLDANREFAITTAPGAQFEPAISGDRVVWQDLRSGTSQIWMGSVSGAFAETAVSPSAGAQSKPSIDGNLIAWQEAGSVWLRDLSGGAAFAIGPGAQPDVDGTLVAYENLGNIYVYDYSTQDAPRQITNDAASQRNAHISGTFVVWEDNRTAANSTDLYGFDLVTGQETALVTGTRRQFLHDVDGTNIAYTEDDAGNLDVYVLKITVTPDPTPTPSAEPTETPDPGELPLHACDDPEAPVYFEKSYERKKGQPQTITDDFAALPGDATICLELGHVSSAFVDLNGARVFSPSDFNPNMTEAEADVSLLTTNRISVELRGAPCDGDDDGDDECGDDDDDGHHGDDDDGDDDDRDDDDRRHKPGHGGGRHHGDDDRDDDDDHGDDDDDGACSTMTVRVVGGFGAAQLAGAGAMPAPEESKASIGEGAPASCSVSGTASSPAGAALLLFGLLAFRRRR